MLLEKSHVPVVGPCYISVICLLLQLINTIYYHVRHRFEFFCMGVSSDLHDFTS